MATNSKPLRLMTLEERREYGRIKQQEFRDRARATPESFEEYKAKRRIHVAKSRERLKNNPVLLAELKARRRERERHRKAGKKAGINR